MIFARTATDRALRRLFWQIMTRGRTAADEKAKKRMGSMGLKMTFFIYLMFGLMPALTAFNLPTLAFAGVMHGVSLMFASLALAASAGNLLFAREETEILLHRPVEPRQLLQAKAWVIIRFALILAFALNFVGLITGSILPEVNLLFAPVHLLSTTLLMVFSAGLTVLVYNLCLKWFGRQRLDTLLTIVQTLLAIAMVAGSQIAPRLLQNSELLADFDATSLWAILLPPVWFGAIDAMFTTATPIEHLWPLAALGVIATIVVAWLAFDRLAKSYGEGLQALGEGSGPAVADDRDRRLHAVTRWPLLSLWLRDPVERHAFVLTSAYLLRDRETKMKIYPGLAPLLVMPVVLIGIDQGISESFVFLDYVMLTYLVIIPIQPLVFLRHTEHYRAAELFRITPLPHWAPLYHGMRKATLVWLGVPSTVVLVAIMLAIRGRVELLLAAVPVVAMMPVYSLVPGYVRARDGWLPLSKAPADLQNASLGCMVMAVAMGSAMLVAVIGGVLAQFGFGLVYAGVAIVASLLLQRVLTRGMLAHAWNPTRS